MAWPEFRVMGFLRKLVRPIRERLAEEPELAAVPAAPRLALLTSCGVHLRAQDPFTVDGPEGDHTYRWLPLDVADGDWTVTHTHYDNSGVLADLELALPRTAARALVAEGRLGSVHHECPTFCGYLRRVEEFIDGTTREVAERLRDGGAEAALLTPC